MNRDNLLKLAAYLENLPADYEHFSMASYFEPPVVNGRPHLGEQEALRNYSHTGEMPCGTVACAAGHGPAAGIPFPKSTQFYGWMGYIDAVFNLGIAEESFLFSGMWTSFDDTPLGAAQRIYYLLESGADIHEFMDMSFGFSESMQEMIDNYVSFYVERQEQANA